MKHLSFAIFLAVSLQLTACSAKDKLAPGMKVGLHFDAVLEFVIEYPLEWKKARRVTYGSDVGEVRWVNTEDPTTIIRVISLIAGDTELPTERKLLDALPQHTHLSITFSETVSLPAGDATHIRASTEKGHIDAHLLTISNRCYIIALETSTEGSTKYQPLLSKVTQSFGIVQ